ncbi:MAG TPA: nuclease-related domain-containing protein [Marmoricola sp.]
MAELSTSAVPTRPTHSGRAEQGGDRSRRSGEAQQATAAGLDLLRVLGWLVLHDMALPGDPRRRVDHVLAGASGVYVVNTVSWSGAIETQNGSLRCGGTLHDDELAELSDAANGIRALLGGAPVAPLLCFERLEEVVGFAGDVGLCASENILDLLTGQPAILDSRTVAATATMLSSGLVSAPPAPAGGPPPVAKKRTRLSIRTPAAPATPPPPLTLPTSPAPPVVQPVAPPPVPGGEPTVDGTPLEATQPEAAPPEAAPPDADRPDADRLEALQALERLVGGPLRTPEPAARIDEPRPEQVFLPVEEYVVDAVVETAAAPDVEVEAGSAPESTFDARKRQAWDALAREISEAEEREAAERAEREAAARAEQEAREAAEREAREAAERAAAERAEQEAREAAEQEAREAAERAEQEAREAAEREAREAAERAAAARAEQEARAAEPEPAEGPEHSDVENAELAARAAAARAEEEAWEIAQQRAAERVAAARAAAQVPDASVVQAASRVSVPTVVDAAPVQAVVVEAISKPKVRIPRLGLRGRAIDDDERTPIPHSALVMVLLGAVLVAGVIVGAPRMPDVVGWTSNVLASEPAPTTGTPVAVGADGFHPKVRVLAGKPVTAQGAKGSAAPKGEYLVAVPLSLENVGGTQWDVPVAAGTTVADSLGVTHTVDTAVKAVKGRPLLAAQVAVAPGKAATGWVVFSVPNGRTVTSVTVGLATTADDGGTGDSVTWQVAP